MDHQHALKNITDIADAGVEMLTENVETESQAQEAMKKHTAGIKVLKQKIKQIKKGQEAVPVTFNCPQCSKSLKTQKGLDKHKLTCKKSEAVQGEVANAAQGEVAVAKKVENLMQALNNFVQDNLRVDWEKTYPSKPFEMDDAFKEFGAGHAACTEKLAKLAAELISLDKIEENSLPQFLRSMVAKEGVESK